MAAVFNICEGKTSSGNNPMFDVHRTAADRGQSNWPKHAVTAFLLCFVQQKFELIYAQFFKMRLSVCPKRR